jgi:hypothetical protein
MTTAGPIVYSRCLTDTQTACASEQLDYTIVFIQFRQNEVFIVYTVASKV